MHCYENAKGLMAAGHEVHVLTSRHGVTREELGNTVTRSLFLQSDSQYYRPLHFFTGRHREHKHNIYTLRTLVKKIEPDVIVFWGMWNLSKAIPLEAESLGIPVAYWIGDLWPGSPDLDTIYWLTNANHFWSKPLKRLASKIALMWIKEKDYVDNLRFENIAFGSQFLMDSLIEHGFKFERPSIIYCGINLELFWRDVDWNQRYVQRSHRSDIKLIYVGAISEQKGILTLIRSIFFLNQRRSGQVKLTIVGTGSSLEEMKVRSLISQMSLEGLVKIVGYRPNRDLPRFLVKHDALVFPSIIEEGFGRVAAEAMAAGLAVIGSGTGGSAEIIEHEVTGLRFQPGDPINLARQIGFLMDSPSLFVQISAAGQRYVGSLFGLHRMIAEMEQFLLETCAST